MQTGKRKLTKKCDELFSKVVRSRGECQAMGEGGKRCSGLVQCAHIFPRTYAATRWDYENALCLCTMHHLFWAHKNPIGFAEFVHAKIGSRNVDSLKKKAYKGKQWSEKELEALKEKLEHDAGNLIS